MMLRWKIRKNTIIGIEEITSAAVKIFCGAAVLSSYKPMLTVCFDGFVSTRSGHRKSFQTATTAKIDTTPRIGREIGNTTDHSDRTGPAPSMAAAASNSSGIESKNRLRRKMLKPLATDGSQITHGEFVRLTPMNGM